MSAVVKYPLDWKVVKIQDIAEVKGGKRIPKGESLQEEENDHPYIRVADMYMGGIEQANLLYVPEIVFPLIERYTIGKDDLFISVAGTLGIVGKVPVNLDGANLTENADKLTNIKIEKDFLLQILLSPIFQEAVKKGQTNNAQPKLALSQIRSFQIPNPPLPEQQKIANILSTVYAKIEIISQQITETQELKKGLMQRLLTQGIGHTEFKDSPLGKIPNSWEVVTFSSLISKGVITKIQDGNHGGSHPVSDDFVTEGVPFIMANCITTSNKLNLGKAKRISKEQYKSLRIGFAKPNDVLLTHKGTVGLTAIVSEKDGNLMLTPQVTYYRIGKNDLLNREYLYYYFQSSLFQNLIDKFSKQSTRAYIGITNQKKLPITLPNDIIEQNKISNILSSVDQKLEILSEKKTTYQNLKQGLMQQLLTGKVRVKV